MLAHGACFRVGPSRSPAPAPVVLPLPGGQLAILVEEISLFTVRRAFCDGLMAISAETMKQRWVQRDLRVADVVRRQLNLVVDLRRPGPAFFAGEQVAPQDFFPKPPPWSTLVKRLCPFFCHCSLLSLRNGRRPGRVTAISPGMSRRCGWRNRKWTCQVIPAYSCYHFPPLHSPNFTGPYVRQYRPGIYPSCDRSPTGL